MTFNLKIIKIFLLICIGVVLFFLFIIPRLVNIVRANESAQWPYTMGRVTYVNITDFVEHSSKYGTSFHYILHVTYEYKVGEVSYNGDRISFCAEVNVRNTTDTRGYHLGDAIKVYYNPTSPDDSVLLPGLNEDVLWSDLYGIFFFFIYFFFSKFFLDILIFIMGGRMSNQKKKGSQGPSTT